MAADASMLGGHSSFVGAAGSVGGNAFHAPQFGSTSLFSKPERDAPSSPPRGLAEAHRPRPPARSGIPPPIHRATPVSDHYKASSSPSSSSPRRRTPTAASRAGAPPGGSTTTPTPPPMILPPAVARALPPRTRDALEELPGRGVEPAHAAEAAQVLLVAQRWNAQHQKHVAELRERAVERLEAERKMRQELKDLGVKADGSAMHAAEQRRRLQAELEQRMGGSDDEADRGDDPVDFEAIVNGGGNDDASDQEGNPQRRQPGRKVKLTVGSRLGADRVSPTASAAPDGSDGRSPPSDRDASHPRSGSAHSSSSAGSLDSVDKAIARLQEEQRRSEELRQRLGIIDADDDDEQRAGGVSDNHAAAHDGDDDGPPLSAFQRDTCDADEAAGIAGRGRRRGGRPSHLGASELQGLEDTYTAGSSTAVEAMRRRTLLASLGGNNPLGLDNTIDLDDLADDLAAGLSDNDDDDDGGIVVVQNLDRSDAVTSEASSSAVPNRSRRGTVAAGATLDATTAHDDRHHRRRRRSSSTAAKRSGGGGGVGSRRASAARGDDDDDDEDDEEDGGGEAAALKNAMSYQFLRPLQGLMTQSFVNLFESVTTSAATTAAASPADGSLQASAASEVPAINLAVPTPRSAAAAGATIRGALASFVASPTLTPAQREAADAAAQLADADLCAVVQSASIRFAKRRRRRKADGDGEEGPTSESPPDGRGRSPTTSAAFGSMTSSMTASPTTTHRTVSSGTTAPSASATYQAPGSVPAAASSFTSSVPATTTPIPRHRRQTVVPGVEHVESESGEDDDGDVAPPEVSPIARRRASHFDDAEPDDKDDDKDATSQTPPRLHLADAARNDLEHAPQQQQHQLAAASTVTASTTSTAAVSPAAWSGRPPPLATVPSSSSGAATPAPLSRPPLAPPAPPAAVPAPSAVVRRGGGSGGPRAVLPAAESAASVSPSPPQHQQQHAATGNFRRGSGSSSTHTPAATSGSGGGGSINGVGIAAPPSLLPRQPSSQAAAAAGRQPHGRLSIDSTFNTSPRAGGGRLSHAPQWLDTTSQTPAMSPRTMMAGSQMHRSASAVLDSSIMSPSALGLHRARAGAPAETPSQRITVGYDRKQERAALHRKKALRERSAEERAVYARYVNRMNDALRAAVAGDPDADLDNLLMSAEPSGVPRYDVLHPAAEIAECAYDNLPDGLRLRHVEHTHGSVLLDAELRHRLANAAAAATARTQHSGFLSSAAVVQSAAHVQRYKGSSRRDNLDPASARAEARRRALANRGGGAGGGDVFVDLTPAGTGAVTRSSGGGGGRKVSTSSWLNAEGQQLGGGVGGVADVPLQWGLRGYGAFPPAPLSRQQQLKLKQHQLQQQQSGGLKKKQPTTAPSPIPSPSQRRRSPVRESRRGVDRDATTTSGSGGLDKTTPGHSPTSTLVGSFDAAVAGDEVHAPKEAAGSPACGVRDSVEALHAVDADVAAAYRTVELKLRSEAGGLPGGAW